MSFKPATSGVDIVNMALGMVSETKTISSFDDAGAVAQAARKWYKPVVARLLEMHHWGLATLRSPTIGATNNRSNEWLYAYAAPADMAFPVGLVLGNGTSSVSYYRGLAGLLGMIDGRPVFQHAGTTIYSNIAGDLEYVSYDITEADFTATFADIVILMLASRFALELPKDKSLSESLAKDATTAMNMAFTQNLNAGNHKYGAIASEAELARGIGHGYNWDYFPLGPGA